MGRSLGIKCTLFLLLAGLISLPCSASRIRRVTKKSKEYFESGQLKKYTRVRTAQSIGYDADNNFKKTVVFQKEYHPNGRVKTIYRNVTKIASVGRPCYEVKTIEKTYDGNGVLRRKEIRRCDRGKTIVHFYNEKGKRIFTSIVYDIL
ncbi:MAG: hypothetical protein IT233_07055 [Bacteroidia bacterium]|nr:hypothetical protein [Bacteroidia bacterium]